LITFEMARRVFHGHLDECQQCRDHPFDLCQIGQMGMRLCELSIPNPIVLKTSRDWDGSDIRIDPSEKPGHVKLVNRRTNEAIDVEIGVLPPPPEQSPQTVFWQAWETLGIVDPNAADDLLILFGRKRGKEAQEAFYNQYMGKPFKGESDET
tara:strand:- start:536 stop:991 length:456 start_codon:yes stop_codon:yes gene_type:complete